MSHCDLVVILRFFAGYHRGGGNNYNRDRRGDHPGSHANFGRRDRRDSDRRPPQQEDLREATAGNFKKIQ